ALVRDHPRSARDDPRLRESGCRQHPEHHHRRIPSVVVWPNRTLTNMICQPSTAARSMLLGASAAALVLLPLLLPRAGGAAESVRLTAAGATLEVQLERHALRDNGEPLLEWVRRSADIVSRYYDRFPAASGTVRVVDRDGEGVQGGTTWANPN